MSRESKHRMIGVDLLPFVYTSQQMELGLPLFHSSMLVLVDRRRQIRGFCDGLGDDHDSRLR